MKTRKEISNDYKWNFDNYNFDKEIIEVEKTFENISENVKKYNGKLNDAKSIFDLLEFLDKEEIVLVKFIHYVSNLYNVDNGNLEAIKLYNKVEIIINKLSEVTSFIEPQLLKLSNQFLNGLLKDKRCKNYDNYIKYLLKRKAHKVDENTNKILTKFGAVLDNEDKVFGIITDSEMTFEDAIDSKGKKYQVNNGSYAMLVRSKDKQLRTTAYASIGKTFMQFNKTLFNLYINSVKTSKLMCDFHNYKTVLESKLDDEDIPKIVFDNIIKFTNQNLNLLQGFVKEYAKKHKFEKVDYVDLLMDSSTYNKFSIDNAKNLILAALQPLGEDYLKLVNKKFSDYSIDYLPNKNKRSGAYSSSNYNCKNLILLNYTYDFDSVSTLAHEMGHCINAELYNANQPMQKANITIFLAEIASTVNEMLLNLYMQKNSKNKLYFIEQLLKDARSTIYTQVLYSEFELYVHKMVESNTSITQQELNDYYFNLHKKYYGKSCTLPKYLSYAWSRIPHFYTPYYVYAYATGLVTAINIVNKILNEKDYYKKYIYFLKNGTNKEPIDILKEIDIDLTTAKPYESAFNFIKNMLYEYKQLK